MTLRERIALLESELAVLKRNAPYDNGYKKGIEVGRAEGVENMRVYRASQARPCVCKY